MLCVAVFRLLCSLSSFVSISRKLAANEPIKIIIIVWNFVSETNSIFEHFHRRRSTSAYNKMLCSLCVGQTKRPIWKRDERIIYRRDLSVVLAQHRIERRNWDKREIEKCCSLVYGPKCRLECLCLAARAWFSLTAFERLHFISYARFNARTRSEFVPRISRTCLVPE